jgi:pimeloyl-ACP methyl ester carboxylesterase
LKLPADIQRQLVLVSGLASAEDSIRTKIPDLIGLVSAVLQKLEKGPAMVPVRDPGTPEQREVAIGKFDLQQVTAGLLGTRAGKRAIPALYYNLSVENYRSQVVQEVARDILQQRTGSIGSAMGYAMDCASGASVARRRMIQQQANESILGGDIDFPIPQVCAECGLRELPSSFRAPVQCDVPTLFISGSFDGRTPPSNAEEVRQGFSHSWHVIIEGAGHGNELFISSAAIGAVILEFMKTGQGAVETIRLPPLQFQEL